MRSAGRPCHLISESEYISVILSAYYTYSLLQYYADKIRRVRRTAGDLLAIIEIQEATHLDNDDGAHDFKRGDEKEGG